MFLAAVNILGPIAAVCIFVVQQAADAQLLGSCAIPAGPVACARCLVAKYAIQPVTMFGGYGTICKRLVHWLQTRYSINSNMHCRSHRWSKSWTMPVGRHSLKHDDGCIMHIYTNTLTRQLFVIAIIGSPWIVAAFGDAAMFASKHQTIRTVIQFRLIIYAFPISIAIRDIADDARLCLAWIFLCGLLCVTTCKLNLTKKNKKKRRKKKSILFHLQSEMETQSLGANCPRFPIVIH